MKNGNSLLRPFPHVPLPCTQVETLFTHSRKSLFGFLPHMAPRHQCVGLAVYDHARYGDGHGEYQPAAGWERNLYGAWGFRDGRQMADTHRGAHPRQSAPSRSGRVLDACMKRSRDGAGASPTQTRRHFSDGCAPWVQRRSGSRQETNRLSGSQWAGAVVVSVMTCLPSKQAKVGQSHLLANCSLLRHKSTQVEIDRVRSQFS
jgi:hypothetical protein